MYFIIIILKLQLALFSPDGEERVEKTKIHRLIKHSYLKDMVWKPIEIGFCYDLYQRTGRNKLQKMGC